MRPRSDKGALERVGDLVEAIAEQVSVDVHRHRSARMAEHLLHDFDVRAAGNGEAGGGVSQLVRVQFGNADRRGRDVEAGAEDRSA